MSVGIDMDRFAPTIAKKNIRDKVERLVGVYKKLSSYKNTEKVKNPNLLKISL